MIKILSPHPNAPIPKLENILLVMQEWPLSKESGLRWKDLRRFMIYYFANPRDVAYMLSLAKETLNRFWTHPKVDIILAPNIFDQISSEEYTWINQIWAGELINPSQWDNQLLSNLRNKKYDAVIFLFPDPLGMGWEQVERLFYRYSIQYYLAINGRRRFFFLDRASRNSIRLRKLVARNPWLDFFRAAATVVTAFVTGIFDLLTNMRHSR
jgi:hypothetical protein